MHLLTGQSDGIMPVLLSDDELDVLVGLSPLNAHLYVFGIRRYMDYKTGIVGIKRGISYQSLSEIGSTNEEQGRHTSKCNKLTRNIIRRSLENLEKVGLIKRDSIRTKDKKKLILTCVLARTDLSREKYDDAMMALADDAYDDAKSVNKNSINKEVKQKYKGTDDTYDDASKNRMMTLPPVSGKDIKHNNTGVVFFELTQKMGLSEIAATKLLDENTEKYILEKLKLVMGSDSYKKGNIKNLPAYFQKAIADDFKGVQSIKESNVEQKRGDVKGAACKASECKKQGIKSFTVGTRWYWFCDEHIKIEQEREKAC
jgi:hypothetical protein